jgi:N-acetyltransferase
MNTGNCPPPFELQPTLSGKLLSLRPLTPEDWEALFAVASDPLIWEQHPASDRYQEKVFREFFREALASGGAFVVIDAADGRIIGSTRYLGYDPEKSEIEIGFTFLARHYWGGTYNREMKELMLRHAFRFVRHVVFLVGPSNWRSQKALEKIGAVRVESRLNPAGQECVVFQLDAPPSGDAILS